MPPGTLVLELAPGQQRELEERLSAGDFEYRQVDHARFSARGEGVVATLYRSGKLVVQGRDLEAFSLRYLEAFARPDERRTPPGPVVDEPLIGSDEAGKGDYFGPLVVCAFELPPEARPELEQAGVTDSKKLSDARVLRLAPYLMERFEYAIEALEPPDYNREHARVRNLNPMLATLHARAIRRLAEPGSAVLVDRFADERLISEQVSDLDLRLRQTPRAESEPAVAAASIIARACFLERIRALSEEVAVELHKGAGPPTDRAAREFVALHGREALQRVAKLHFKNTGKLEDRLG